MTDTSTDPVRVLVTRPAAQAQDLCDALRASGARVFLFPVIQIEPVARNDELLTIIDNLAGYDLAIFISSNAVSCAWPIIREKYARWPETVRVAAVGKATADTLKALGTEVTIVPEGRFDSENLLRHPLLRDMVKQRVLIIRGVGGRELLASELQKRGAHTEYLEVYRRVCPVDVDMSIVSEFCQAPGYVVCTSANGIDNLLSLVDSETADCLRGSKLVVVSERMAAHARQAGFANDVLVAANASNRAIIDTITGTPQ